MAAAIRALGGTSRTIRRYNEQDGTMSPNVAFRLECKVWECLDGKRDACGGVPLRVNFSHGSTPQGLEAWQSG